RSADAPSAQPVDARAGGLDRVRRVGDRRPLDPRQLAHTWVGRVGLKTFERGDARARSRGLLSHRKASSPPRKSPPHAGVVSRCFERAGSREAEERLVKLWAASQPSSTRPPPIRRLLALSN